MAKPAVLLLATAICFLSFLGFALCHDDHFFVEGQVYCDTCRTQFVTRVSKPLPGSKVRLECRNREGGDLTYSTEGETDEHSTYRLQVDGDHEEEVCEIVLVKSKDPDCNEVSSESYHKRAARIGLTANNGMVSPTRLANPLGFLKKEALPECADVLKEMGILPDGLV